MCISPISIPNPNYGLDPKKYPLKNVTDVNLSVPCGYCKECIAVRQMYLVQRVQAEALKNHFFFCTLTYNNESIPTIDVNGYKIRYGEVKDVQNMMKRLKKSNVFGIPFRYFAVYELGSSRGRPHFHILFMFEKKYFDKRNYYVDCNHFASVHEFDVLHEWRRNLGSTRNPIWQPLCTYVKKLIRGRWKFNYEFKYVYPNFTDSGISDVGFYVLKYMLKPSNRAIRLQRALRMNLPSDVYESVWSKVKPRYFKSLGFGLGAQYDVNSHDCSIDGDIYRKLRDDVRISVASPGATFPMFFKDDGSSWPLSPYYKNHWSDIVTVDDKLQFHSRTNTVDNSSLREHKTFSQIQTLLINYEEILKKTDSGFDADDMDFLFD